MPAAKRFPDPRLAGEEGLLCVGGRLDTESLLEAYSSGIFPWPQEGLPLLWFSPKERGVLDFAEMHWPKRFLRELKKPGYQITFNKSFAEVIRECSLAPRSLETGTWILPEMERAYSALHRAGHAHSVECRRDGKLVGGLYGVYVGGVFSGESMFFKESGASKRCLHALVEKLKTFGLEWMDIQMVTPVLKALGGKYVTRDEFLQRLVQAKASGRPARLVF